MKRSRLRGVCGGSLNEKHFFHFQELLAVTKRSHHGPFFGWLSSQIRIYPDTMNLKTQVHLRDGVFSRPAASIA